MIRSQKAKTFRGMLASMLVAVMFIASIVTTPALATAAAKPAISKASQNILVGKKYNFDVKNKVKGSTYTWKSSDKKVATVNNRGIVTGVKKGTATITCEIKAPKATYEISAKVTIRVPAKGFEITNTADVLNVGQKWNLNRTLTPKSSNDLTKWTSSDTKIAAPNSNGIFTAKKAGEVTITGTTLSKATDKVTIKVIDRDGIVTTQEELDALLGTTVGKITIKTDEAVTLNIKKGDYKKTELIVDAPKADVVNEGNFKSVEIKQIKADTWTEKASGNTITISAANGRIIVDKDAVVSLRVAKKDAAVTIVNNGKVEELVVDAKATVKIEGTSKEVINVVVTKDAKDAKITANVPVDFTLEAKVTLVLEAGAIGSTVRVANKDLKPEVQGVGVVKVIVGEGENAVEETVVATPVTPSTPGGSTGGGGGYEPTPTPVTTETVTANEKGEFKLARNYKEAKSVTVKYPALGDDGVKLEGQILTLLTNVLSDQDGYLEIWNMIPSLSKEDDNGNKVTITATSDSNVKKVSIYAGDIQGREYTVTVNENAGKVTVIVKAGDNAYTISTDGEKVLTITNAPKDLKFVVNY